MSFRKTKPTKTNLLIMQKKLSFTLKGKTFLDYKREKLIQQIKDLYPTYLSRRKEFYSSYKNVMYELFESYKEMGSRNIELIRELSKIQYNPKLSVKLVKRIGTVVSEIMFESNIGKKLPAYSFENTGHHFDDLTIELKNFFINLILLAEIEDIMLKFAYDFQKLNRRINGLKNIIIPNLSLEIKQIKEILEELERENYVRLKKTRDIIVS